MRTACFPWYALDELRPAQDALWALIADALRERGVRDVPARLTHDAPVPRVLTDPSLLLGQCCGYDLIYGFTPCLRPVATPCFTAEGCEGPAYRSFVLVREESPAADLEDLRGATAAINSFNSHSGTNAFRSVIAPLADDGRFFGKVVVTGAHEKSLAALKAGAADAMAIDCVVHALLAKHRPGALAGTRILARTDPAPAPPFVTSTTLGADTAKLLGETLKAVLASDASRAAREAMLLDGVAFLAPRDYAPLLAMEATALTRGYGELHATSPVLAREADA